MPLRYFSQFLFMAAVMLLSVQSLQAQLPPPVEVTESVLPESVVLVLKLVSATRVKPTTGIVISTNGLVLVPADFVSAGDEIVVLDGGTDIIRNGRPSRILQRYVADGLAILAVEGLSRPAIILSGGNLLQARNFHLAAFPPAEKMAQGAQPLAAPVKLTKPDPGAGFSISADTPLPNITGPVIDNCGYLVGLNLATGEPSLATDKNPVSIFGQDLSRVLRSMQINLQRGICQEPVSAKNDVPPEEELPEELPEKLPEELPGELPVEAPSAASQGALTVPPPAVVTGSSPSVVGMIPLWLWIIGAAILAGLLIKLIFFLRLSKHDPQQSVQQQAASDDHPSSTEPDTAPLDAGSDSSTRNSGIKPSDEKVMPDIHALPDGFDGIVIVEGFLGDGSNFKRYCVVNLQQINVVIGRGEADIGIEMPALSRRHARLENAGESLTISDLGSSNGTFIRGIPCLPREIMFIDPEDEILLGDISFRINVLRGESK